MTELFKDIPSRVRKQTEFWVDMALKCGNPIQALQMIEEYRNSCFNEEERDFLNFYFNLKMEQLTSK